MTNFMEEVAESLEQQRRDAASGQCTHNAFLFKKFLPDKRIPILQHPPNLRIWHPVTFFCSPK